MENNIINPPARFERQFCSARLIASPAAPMSVIIDDIGTPKNVSALTITIVYKIIRINETRKLTAASSTVDRFINLFMIFIIILDISIPSKKIINAKSSVGKASLSVSVSFVRKSVAFSAYHQCSDM